MQNKGEREEEKHNRGMRTAGEGVRILGRSDHHAEI